MHNYESEVVDYTDRQYPLDMRGAAVAKPGALDYQQLKALFRPPGETVADVADKKMIGAEVAGKAAHDRHSLFFIH